MILSPSAIEILELVKGLTTGFQERLKDRDPEFPQTELSELAACGALPACLPLSEGGLGLGIDPSQSDALLSLLFEIGRANQVLGRIFEGHVNALLLVSRFGTPAQIEEVARDVVRHNRVFGVWNTGPARQPAVERRDGGTLLFTGGKSFASGAGQISRAIVTGLLNGRDWQMFLLPLDEIDYAIDYDSWQPMGMEASDSFSVDFTGVELDASSLLGQADDYYAEPMFTGGAFRFSAVQMGGAAALFDFCRDYLCELNYDKDPHQLHRMGQLSVLVESGRQWIAQAARWMSSDEDPDLLPTRARMVRVAIAQICQQVADTVEICVGARGLQGRRPFARMLRDLRMYLRQAGADAAVTAIGRASLDRRI